MRQGLGKAISLLLCVLSPSLAGATGPALTGADVAKQVEQALNEAGVAASLSGRLPAAAPAPAGPSAAGAGPAPPAGGNRRRTRRKNTRA